MRTMVFLIQAFLGDFLYNAVLVNDIQMKSQNSRKDSDLQLKQYTTEIFRCYLIASSTTYEIHLLCYARMKAQLDQG